MKILFIDHLYYEDCSGNFCGDYGIFGRIERDGKPFKIDPEKEVIGYKEKKEVVEYKGKKYILENQYSGVC